MARINVEDSIWSDPRFMRLCIKLGDERTAIGAIVLAWKLAQKHCNNSNIIPNEEWVRSAIGREIIDAGLAKEMENGIYVCGSREHFAWYAERREAAKKGGKARAEKANRDKQGKMAKKSRQTPADSSQTLDGVQPSYSSSSSYSSSASHSSSFSEGEKNTKPAGPKAAPPGTQNVIARYVELWQARYKAKIHLAGRDVGLLRTLTKDHGEQSAIKLLEAYLQIPDAWFVTKRHDVGTMLQNLNVVSHFMETGKVVTRKDVKNLDSQVHTQSMIGMVERGEI